MRRIGIVFLGVGLALSVMVMTNIGASSRSQTHKVFPYPTIIKDFDNGLRAIIVPTDYPNIVSLQIPVSVGSRNEIEPGKSGFAHFFEHMMFRGTEAFPSEKYDAILKEAGADQNAYTSDDLTNYHITFSKEDLETVLMLEADRFQKLKYSVDAFQTESKAVLGEYNKNVSDPFNKLEEVQHNVAFTTHTYKHTTMGFLEDILDMPNQYDYSLTFFDRFYRPENTTIILAGDLDPDATLALIEKYWGAWKRGEHQAEIPQEPEPKTPAYAHVPWASDTLPWVTVAFHGPAFSAMAPDMAVMDVIARLAFSPSSELYQQLVVEQQIVNDLFAYFYDSTDPGLLTVAAQVNDPKEVWRVRDAILKTFAQLRVTLVSYRDLRRIQSNLRNELALSLDNSEAIAQALVGYVARTRDPDTINRVYDLYAQVTPESIVEKANQYFTDSRLVVVTLSHEVLPDEARPTGSVDEFAQVSPPPDIATVVQNVQSPLINFRILFNTGAAGDPPGKAGLAQLTASMIAEGGSQRLSYKEIQKALQPMAASFNAQVDKEMTVFQGAVSQEDLQEYVEIVFGQLVEPAWNPADFDRVKTQLINDIIVSLRSNNDEELGKEILYEQIYAGHPYGHLTLGHVKDIERLTLEDVQVFYRMHYTQGNVVLGLAGPVTDDLVTALKRQLGTLSAGESPLLVLPPVPVLSGYHADILQKNTRGVAVSLGFPIEVTRSHPDFAALWLARSYLGEHRSSNSHLFQRIREIRGMNYGDYAYIEYFPRGMFQFHPDPNLGRRAQIFQIWIRPVVSNLHAHFATRVALYELNKLITEGLSEADFVATRQYLLKFVNILTKSQDRQLGYALDSRYYETGEFVTDISAKLRRLTLEDINRAIRKHLQTQNIYFVFITPDAQDLKNRLVTHAPSPMTYSTEKPPELLSEDKIIEVYPLPLASDQVVIRPAETVFSE